MKQRAAIIRTSKLCIGLETRVNGFLHCDEFVVTRVGGGAGRHDAVEAGFGIEKESGGKHWEAGKNMVLFNKRHDR